MKVTVHEFKASLDWSLDIQKKPFWQQIYETFFGPGIVMALNPIDGVGQRLGADRIVILPGSSACIRVDEKIRKESYPDILLEHLSSKQRNTPGWICKPLLADYIAYVNLPMEICHLLPTHALQRAWAKYGEQWKREYQEIKANNGTYQTVCAAVPIDVLYQAMNKVMRVPFCQEWDFISMGGS